MMQDTIGQALALLGIDERRDAEATAEVEGRAIALLQVALTVLDRRAGRERTVGLVEAVLNAIPDREGERATLALAATPPGQLADTLLGFLRQRDANDPGQALSAHGDAAAMIVAGIAFLHERHGGPHMCAYTDHLVRAVQGGMAAGQPAVSAPTRPAPVLPAPDVIRDALDRARIELGLRQRIETMVGFLRSSAPGEGQAMALSSFMAAGLFLREQRGEAYAVDALRHVERTVSEQAALDRWQPEAGAAAN